MIVPESLKKTAFGDVVIDPLVVHTLQSIISLPLLHPHHFDAGILANESLSGILLYGPPGTGKTMVCRALAHEFGIPMLLVNPSDIFDKYLGESDKRARAVFVSLGIISLAVHLKQLSRILLIVSPLALYSLMKLTHYLVLGRVDVIVGFVTKW
jgi:ATPase family associated with various cellular activities (AAA)